MARPSIIRKTAADLKVAPHWTDYEAGRVGFSWEQVRRELGGAVNIADAAVERHLAGERVNRTAFRFCRRRASRP